MARKKVQPKKQTLEQDVAGMRQWQEDHGKHDDERHQENIARFAEGTKTMEGLASKEDLKGLASKVDLADFAKLFVETDDRGDLKFGADGQMIPRFATKADVAPVKAFYDKLALSAQIVDGGGKWLSRAVFWLAAFLVAWSVITGKVGLLLAWIVSHIGSTPR